MENEIKKVLIIIDSEEKYFKGDALTSPVQQAILYLKELEKDFFDE